MTKPEHRGVVNTNRSTSPSYLAVRTKGADKFDPVNTKVDTVTGALDSSSNISFTIISEPIPISVDNKTLIVKLRGLTAVSLRKLKASRKKSKSKLTDPPPPDPGTVTVTLTGLPTGVLQPPPNIPVVFVPDLP
jgi:hypothetical protein